MRKTRGYRPRTRHRVTCSHGPCAGWPFRHSRGGSRGSRGGSGGPQRVKAVEGWRLLAGAVAASRGPQTSDRVPGGIPGPRDTGSRDPESRPGIREGYPGIEIPESRDIPSRRTSLFRETCPLKMVSRSVPGRGIPGSRSRSGIRDPDPGTSRDLGFLSRDIPGHGIPESRRIPE